MKAVLLPHHGGPEVLRVGEAPDPKAGAGEIVVDVHVASINAADTKRRKGSGRYDIKQFPHILGRDFSGVVAALGPGVLDFKVGDEVWGVTDQGIEGCYAEKVALKASLVARKPASLSHEQAAALALTGITAACALIDTAKLQRGETVLIHGGAGGVASLGIQIAKHIGARVITTASKGNHDYVRGLGADQVIDYNAEDFTTALKDCDVVFDTVGGDVQTRSYKVLKPGGRLVWVAPPGPQPPPRGDVQTLRPDVKRDRSLLERILTFVAAGAVRPPEITRYPLEQAAEAHRVSDGRHLRGKLVLAVR